LGIYVLKIGSKTSILTIESVRAYHGGNYTCTATNSAGLSQFTAYLAVNGIVLHIPLLSGFHQILALCLTTSSVMFPILSFIACMVQ
jgi:hypothetical protein